MPTGNINLTADIGGISASGVAQRSAAGQISGQVDALTDGKAGAMSSVNSARNAGVVDGLDTGHGIIATNIIALFQVADAADGSIIVRYGIRVDTANVNDIVFDDTPAAAGDDLPVDGVPVVVSVYTEALNVDFDGDDMLQLVLVSSINAVIQFTENDDTEIAVVVLKADEPFAWSKGSGFANPLTGNAVGKVNIAPGSADVGTFKMGILLDIEI